ncbi:MAG: hydrolase [Clostridia bacterium]|nr:hydrolase [Clostridia bacterium]
MIEKQPIPMTQEEQKRPYAKYYKTQLAQPNIEQMEKLNKGPIDPQKAILPENLNELIKNGYIEAETGYCILENGAGYMTVSNEFPGCSLEMIYWWYAWHTLEGLRYKIWNPFCHQTIAISDEHREKITNPSIPLEEKSRGVIHFEVENIGAGFQDIVIHFLTHKELGIAEELDTSKATIIGGYGLIENREVIPGKHKGKMPAIMIHNFRETKYGVESRTIYWLGYRINKGFPVLVLPRGVTIPVEVPMGLAINNVQEFSHLASILPDIYKEFGNLPL